MINLTDSISLQELWERINEGMVVDAKKIIDTNGASYGTQMISYNNIGIANKAWVDPEFDMGKVFGYTNKKWSALVKNYVDFNYLDILRKEIGSRTKKKSRSYNYQFQFSNKHGSGKDCLVALIFSAKLNEERPTVTFMTRVSEVTCRLIFDFVLVQRCIEYVYGHNNVEVIFIAPTMFQTAERFSMYHNHRNINKLLKKIEHPYKYQDRVKTVLDKMLTTHPDLIKYKVNKRSAKNLQKDANGNNLSGVKSMKIKELIFNIDTYEYPEDCITDKQRKDHKKSL